ncbi:integration host factor subunit beta [Methylotenera sp.]|jgi:integration host factor subunit beta|uniref:integration host factor subunit beta n=1 Tax=Methylotenera sp. TaxID=2051956 RepID=UPI002724D9A9|nr:integration host factor subunit beta [Methylotenera sp.]MDO9205035.1 integration host factor subunit beta [Methylotenera sp.]MDO9393890.1 integration host factor subunit beta [Methylotenera sp.]MDP1523654.1 integration host factor subunit beta [Methylotenera sp.]MDP2071616.1 integration host factor subunit beta [Methylotenera sp.]MDP2229324.1 integration host factor subunit beta [Methylotenera sp.]
MTRSELIQNLRDKFSHLTLEDVNISVKVILDEISNKLAEGSRAEIRGFGTFKINYKPPRISRNPRTGERVEVPEKYVPNFKAGHILRDKVNQ